MGILGTVSTAAPGGPDTITAYAMEDNELWLRHFLGLLVQFGEAFYIFLLAWKGMPLNILAIPIFVAGLIKYGERTWALRSASSSHFRDAMLPCPDPGPNYAKIMGEYTLQRNQGFNASLRPVIEPSTRVNSLDPDAPILQVGYDLFNTFKRLFADLILTFQDREKSQSFFHNTTWQKAFAVIEVELGFMYDVLYTKACVNYSCRWGHLLRFVSLSFTVSTFVAFLLIDRHEHSTIDLIITFLLLVGAIVLEIYAIIVLLSSDWTMLWLSKHGMASSCCRLPILQPADRRWSNSMAQYNLLGLCLKEKPIKCLGPLQRLPGVDGMLEEYCLRQDKGILRRFSYFYEMLEEHSYKSYVTVSDDLKGLIFQHLKDKSNRAKGQSNANAIYKQLCASRGDLVLKEKYNCYINLDQSMKEDFDQNILLWHIATDLLYYRDDHHQNSSPGRGPDCKATSKLVSDYTLYLLVMRPFMLPDGIGKMRFQDSCAEAIQFLQDNNADIKGRTDACRKLLRVNTEVSPLEVKGDKSKSVLFDAVRLAKSLQSLETDGEYWSNGKKWEMMCDVWVEMLYYAASQCGWKEHAQQLRRGAELLTHVWLLMAHFGISEHFKISQGHARSTVVVT